MASAGSLVVSLGLDAAQYTSGLTKAQYQARQFGEEIGRGIRVAGIAAFAALGAASVAAVAIINRSAEEISGFKGISEQIGDTASAVAGLKLSADLSGVSLDTVGKASVKLTAELAKTKDESKGAGSAIKALGLNLNEFKQLSPTEQLKATAGALAKFEDGAGKTAVAVQLFGRAGAELIPFFNDLAEAGETQIRLTDEQIEAVDSLGKVQARFKSEMESVANLIVAESTPAIIAFTGAIQDTIRDVLGLSGGVSDFASNKGIQEFSQNAVKALGFVIDAIDGVVRVFQIAGNILGAVGAGAAAIASGDFKSAINIAKDGVAQIDGILQRETFSSRLNKRIAEAGKGVGGAGVAKPTLRAPNPRGSGGGSKGDDPTKRILDNELKMLENARKQEEDILRSRNRMLDLYNGENLISTQAYFEGKRAAQSASVSSQIALYDQEIEALQKYQSSAKKATDRETAQGKINDLLEKKVRLTREAGETAIEWGFKERKAMEDLSRQINSVNAEVLELTGNLGAAARIRVDDQFGDLTKRLTAEGDSAGLAQVNRLKQLKIAQADYSQQSEGVARITEGLRIQEERIALARQLGTTGELESLAKLGESRRGALAEMEAMVAAQEAIARASGNPALVQNAERARLELEKLAAVADPLAEKFNTLFADAAGSAFSDFINGTKTAKEAFKSFTDTIFKELTNLIVKDLFKQLFSGGGTGTGGMGFDFGSLLSGLFGGGKAVGGPVSAGRMYEVNERGPELLDVNGKQMLMMGGRNGRITPNNALGGGGMAVTVNQTFASGTSKQTTDQAALSAGRAIERARRNS